MCFAGRERGLGSPCYSRPGDRRYTLTGTEPAVKDLLAFFAHKPYEIA